MMLLQCVAATLLALSPVVAASTQGQVLNRVRAAHSSGERSVRHPELEEVVGRRRDIQPRQAQTGAACGSTAGGAACAAGLCCSEQGVCGTGTAFCGAPGCQLSFGPACDGNQVPPGKDTSTVPRPQFGNVPYGVDISHCTVNGKVAITFDDGPYLYSSDLLDLLKRNGVHATFFIVGANGGKGQIQNAATGYPPIVKRMIADGHQVGSHTWSHQDLSAITPQQRRDQIIRNEIAISSILGFFPTYLRPPYTRWTPDALNDLKALGYHVTNYDIDTRDWQGDYNYAQNLYTQILSQHSPASSSWIAIAHDIQEQTVRTFAQYMIDQARKLNYTLVTVGECMGDPSANWYRDPTTGGPFDPAQAPPPGAPASASASASPLSATSAAGAGQAAASTLAPSVTPTPTSIVGANFGAGTGGTTQAASLLGTAATTTSIPGATVAPLVSGSAMLTPSSGVNAMACMLFVGVSLLMAI